MVPMPSFPRRRESSAFQKLSRKNKTMDPRLRGGDEYLKIPINLRNVTLNWLFAAPVGYFEQDTCRGRYEQNHDSTQ